MRGEALDSLLAEHAVAFDAEDHSFFIDNILEKDVPGAALRFVSFSLRVRDFLLMTEYRVASTFREDAARELHRVVGDRATMAAGDAIAPEPADSPADFVLRAEGTPPVGIYPATSDKQVYEATLVHGRAVFEANVACAVPVLIERASVVSDKARQQAENRIATFAEFRGAERAAIEGIAREAIGTIHWKR